MFANLNYFKIIQLLFHHFIQHISLKLLTYLKYKENIETPYQNKVIYLKKNKFIRTKCQSYSILSYSQ